MDKKTLNPEGLENISGGVMRTVDTNRVHYRPKDLNKKIRKLL